VAPFQANECGDVVQRDEKKSSGGRFSLKEWNLLPYRHKLRTIPEVNEMYLAVANGKDYTPTIWMSILDAVTSLAGHPKNALGICYRGLIYVTAQKAASEAQNTMVDWVDAPQLVSKSHFMY
jgi:hypothetical protein